MFHCDYDRFPRLRGRNDARVLATRTIIAVAASADVKGVEHAVHPIELDQTARSGCIDRGELAQLLGRSLREISD
jgi:hypothetical protein